MNEEWQIVLIEELLKTCDDRMVYGPKYTFKARPGGWGYLIPQVLLKALIDSIQEVTEYSQTEDKYFCGGSRLTYQSLDQMLLCSPFSRNYMSRRDTELVGIIKSWIVSVNRITFDSYESVPWYVVRKLLIFYLSETEKIIYMNKIDDPSFKMMKRGIDHIRDGEYGISHLVTKERCIWQILLLRDHFIDKRILYKDIIEYRKLVIDQHVNTNDHVVIDQHANTNVHEIQYHHPTIETIQNERPQIKCPINKTKTHLTELLRYIDENQSKWSMRDGEYLKVVDMLKVAFESV